MREFYVSYAATLRGSISKRSKPLAQDPLTSTLVRGCPVDISPAMIRRFLYGPTAGHSWSLNIAEFDYRWDIVRSGAFQRNSEQREAVILWLARYIATDGERAEWVTAPRLGIRKATLTFVAKFFWLLVRNRVSPTKADNQVTDTRGHWTSTTYPFPCLIFFRGTRVSIGIVAASPPYRALDIGLIRDEANNKRGDDLSAPDHTDTIPGSSSQAASMGPSSSRSTPLRLGHCCCSLGQSTEVRGSDGHTATSHPAEDAKVDCRANIASLQSDVEAILAAPSVEP
ncbi:hypothetical protein H5410_004832 [Solanum commersonii]|uniref:Putative plant transposon protein domain-containing protein n=1 Tax=Solanum commersonii TaxID=4109 RepID=A0A9J6A4Q4_SOLCO|nr:hypothetical protein H5410_004832 [Solanum commersonii]